MTNAYLWWLPGRVIHEEFINEVGEQIVHNVVFEPIIKIILGGLGNAVTRIGSLFLGILTSMPTAGIENRYDFKLIAEGIEYNHIAIKKNYKLMYRISIFQGTDQHYGPVKLILYKQNESNLQWDHERDIILLSSEEYDNNINFATKYVVFPKEPLVFKESGQYKLMFGNKSRGITVQKGVSQPTPDNMVFVQGGTFQMGSNSGKPVHTVTVNDFYIGKYEVTQKEWKEVMGSNPSNWKCDNLPVEQVSWYDAVEFCNKKSRKEGLTPCYSGSGKSITFNFNANGYRLPTEAEWEYAAGGGNKSRNYKYSGSNSIGDVAWYRSNSGNKTHQVGTKQPNELGIYDMSGNVYEWCNDWYDENYYSKSPKNNPQGPSSGKYSVLRGGSWYFFDYCCRVAYRHGDNRDFSYGNGGFRIARTP